MVLTVLPAGKEVFVIAYAVHEESIIIVESRFDNMAEYKKRKKSMEAFIGSVRLK